MRLAANEGWYSGDYFFSPLPCFSFFFLKMKNSKGQNVKRE